MYDGCWTVLDVSQDCLLAAYSTPDSPPVLVIGRIPKPGSEEQVFLVVYLFFIPEQEVHRKAVLEKVAQIKTPQLSGTSVCVEDSQL